MKINSYAETDSLYIELSDRPGSDSFEVADGFVVDVDEHGRPVGINIDHASRMLDVTKLATVAFPVTRADRDS